MKKRAAAMIYVLMLITLMAAVTATYLNVSGAAYSTETAREREYAANCALEAGILALTDDLYNSKVTTTSTPSYTPAAGTVSLSMADNTGSVTRTVVASASITYKGKTYRLSRVVGKRTANPAPNLYAVFVDNSSNVASNRTLTTASATLDASTYFHEDTNGGSQMTIGGDLEYAKNLSGTPAVAGQTYSGAPIINFPTVNMTNYTGLGSVLVILFALVGIDLGTGYSNRHFSSTGTMQISGTIVGQGSIAGGSMEITGDLTYFDSSAVAGFIMANNITVDNGVSRIDGYYFCNGKFKTSGPLTVNGSIACSQMELGGNLTVNYDSRIWTNESLASLLKLPGAYP